MAGRGGRIDLKEVRSAILKHWIARFGRCTALWVPHEPVTIRVSNKMPNMDAGRLAPSMDVVWCASELRNLNVYSKIKSTGNLFNSHTTG